MQRKHSQWTKVGGEGDLHDVVRSVVAAKDAPFRVRDVHFFDHWYRLKRCFQSGHRGIDRNTRRRHAVKEKIDVATRRGIGSASQQLHLLVSVGGCERIVAAGAFSQRAVVSIIPCEALVRGEYLTWDALPILLRRCTHRDRKCSQRSKKVVESRVRR